MNVDRYTKLVLVVIALALVMIAGRPLLRPTPGYAARTVEYRQSFLSFHEDWGFNDKQVKEMNLRHDTLNTLGKQGWEVVAAVAIPTAGGIYLVLRR